MQDKNICIVTTSFFGGGAEKVAVNLANSYSDKNNVTIIAFIAKGPYLKQVENKVKIINLDCKRARYVMISLYMVIKKLNPDAILSVVRDANIFTGLSCMFMKKFRVVFREANTMDNIITRNFIKNICYIVLMKLSYIRADRVICNSIDTKNDLLKNFIVKKEKTCVIGNPVISKESYYLRRKNISDDWFDSKKVVLGVGRLHLQKNFQMLIKSFAIAQKSDINLRLVILGEGGRKDELLDLANKLGVNHLFKILDFSDNPYPFYKKAKVLVLSSNWEGFGNVIVESLYCGTQVIATNCPGGPKEILKEIGDIVPINDIYSMSNSILTSVNRDVNKRKLISRANDYKVNIIGAKYLDVIFEL